ncbi:MAG: cysteine--tRNA ligase [Pseudohongiellaceae bacterium]
MAAAEITIYNTLSRKKELLKPLDPGKLRIYVCGLTTYDYSHLGHARMLVAFDVIVRYLRQRGFEVSYVRNITDIDDKILQRANENEEYFSDLTARFIVSMHEDERALGILPPDQEPRATAYIDEIIAMVRQLIDKDYAYRTDSGDVYYSVRNFPDYGKLSNKNLEELLAGARIEVGEAKRDPRDFAVWKAAKEGEVGWDSPWGYGRPGWHIECATMTTHCLGDHFDIHGGGSDLMFPHHENEIAQAVAATGGRFANVWMHNGPLRVDNEKMSKSLGNFFTIRDVLKKYDPEVVRFFLISSHYRSPINYSDQNLEQALRALGRFYTALKGLDLAHAKTLANSRFEKEFYKAMDDDFNTPEAFGVLFDLVKEINRHRETDCERAGQLGVLLVRLAGILGLLQTPAEAFLQGDRQEAVDHDEVEQLIVARNDARARRDWATADQIRDKLTAMKVAIEDGAQGTSWRIER